MEVLVKEKQVAPMRVRLEFLQVAEYCRWPFSSRRKMFVIRRDNSPDTSHNVLMYPDQSGTRL
jgi:hypothetical protein